MSSIVETAVTAVTVYPDRARVTCRGEVALSQGAHQLLVEALPLALQPDSARVGGQGTARVRILSVDVSRQQFEAAPVEQVRELEQEIEAAQDELGALKDRGAAWLAQGKYLDGMRAATAQYAEGLANGQTTVEEQAALLRFLQERETEMRTAVRQLEAEQRDVNRRLDRLQRQLKALGSQRPPQRFQVQVDVECTAEGTFELELSYVAGRAGWRPLYDVRLIDADGRRTVELTTIAQVTQSTGQDWRDVTLTLSTARPALNQRLPELHPWYVDIYKEPPPQLIRPAVRAAAPAALAAAEVGGERQADVAVAEVQESDTAVSFRAPGRTDVPSDGSPHKTTLRRDELDPDLDYLTIPRHTTAVYRRVSLGNDGPAPWLPGTANLFAGDEYIGGTLIKFTPRGEEVELLLGVEERIVVERELVKRDVDKRFLSDKRQLRYAYEITLRNLLGQTAVVELHDQIPVSRHEEIKIKLEQAEPPPSEKSDLNLLEWRLSLAPEAEQTVGYQYLVEHPRSLQVVGLMD